MSLVLALTRSDLGDYIQALGLVYTILIFAYILSSWVFTLGGRIPYSRWSDAILSFLRDVSEPYLRIFRRFIPAIGPFDLSPIVGIIVLQVVTTLVANLVRG
ncbi:MAG: YggT family protein [Solirubrobacterales bacterium]|jgi:YggT family protein|nr:YggT family protein [Solirubrobacterales bacterium]